MSSLREMAEAVRAQENAAAIARGAEANARAQLIAFARSLADSDIARAQVCTKDQQVLADIFRLNAQTLRNLANLVEGAKP